MQIFDEPWTGDLLWKVQSSLPPGGKPLAYILYADKTRLSSFGMAKGYPVMACIANLPDAIHNGKGWGGGTVVGWLPIVEEDPKHKGKLSWINFKQVVWHESFCKIMESVVEYSYTGYAFTLPHSGKTIVIYPFIFILSADYEEHCMMTLICSNVFWSMDQSDPYRAVSWDSLHAYYLGLFKHLLLCLLEHVERIHGPDKRKANVIIDEFYIELDMYTSMDVHMEKSINEGRQLLGVFEANLKAYSQATDHMVWKNVTSWSIPKVHTQQHLFDDIIAKGATKNYNTKVNECMHGPLKEAYQTRTNFKNVADQILMTDHKYGIAMKLRQRTDHNKKHQKEAMASVEQETKVSSKAKYHNLKLHFIVFSSLQEIHIH
ncbi:hypothetical protein IW261DRAFT_1424717 [Armillaria novae-zelandiae]|uniref:Uncharacterized protein n=1 Tax=Armillaria novae-zelandiae TaxID=153914 RepID=A0AA39NU48_9AGAR|nr:hypothetical protein IW261DRAFT_1424717 [Armillaria novae-zelandiae]